MPLYRYHVCDFCLFLPTYAQKVLSSPSFPTWLLAIYSQGLSRSCPAHRAGHLSLSPLLPLCFIPSSSLFKTQWKTSLFSFADYFLNNKYQQESRIDWRALLSNPASYLRIRLGCTKCCLNPICGDNISTGISGWETNLGFTGLGIFIIQHGSDANQHGPDGGV